MAFKWPLYKPQPVDEEAEREQLLRQIDKAAERAAEQYNPEDVIIGLCRRHGRFRPQPLLRLYGLTQPLALGLKDRKIHRAYDKHGGSNAVRLLNGSDHIDHWRRAKIKDRKISGLKRLLDALTPDYDA